MTTTQTTAEGSTLTVNGTTLRIETSSGKQVTCWLHHVTTESTRPGYRALGAILLDTESADWLDAHIRDLQRVERDRAATPEATERRRIHILYNRAERLLDNPGEYFDALSRADEALTAWQEAYPQAAADEEREQRADQADALRSLALGALTYDADGSLNAADQQQRHDELMAQAKKIAS